MKDAMLFSVLLLLFMVISMAILSGVMVLLRGRSSEDDECICKDVSDTEETSTIPVCPVCGSRLNSGQCRCYVCGRKTAPNEGENHEEKRQT